jgi:hypothetical protein
MPLTFAPAPAGSMDALKKGLASLRSELPGVALKALSPIPVYVLSAGQLRSGDGLDRAGLASWECLLVEGDEVRHSARLKCDAAGRCRLTGLASGTASAMQKALEAAERAAGQGAYEVRSLRVPALHLAALWLKAADGEDRDVIVPPAPSWVAADRVYAANELRPLLLPPAPPAGATPA